MDTLIIFFAKYVIWLVVLGGLVYVFFCRDWVRLATSAAASMVFSYGIAKVVAHFWYDTRPFVADNLTPLIPHAPDNGFPSDHMLLGAAIASVVLAYNRTWGIVLWILALLVGLSRVAAGVHHLADIAGSIAIAVCVVAAVEYAMRRLWPARV